MRTLALTLISWILLLKAEAQLPVVPTQSTPVSASGVAPNLSGVAYRWVCCDCMTNASLRFWVDEIQGAIWQMDNLANQPTNDSGNGLWFDATHYFTNNGLTINSNCAFGLIWNVQDNGKFTGVVHPGILNNTAQLTSDTSAVIGYVFNFNNNYALGYEAGAVFGNITSAPYQVTNVWSTAIFSQVLTNNGLGGFHAWTNGVQAARNDGSMQSGSTGFFWGSTATTHPTPAYPNSLMYNRTRATSTKAYLKELWIWTNGAPGDVNGTDLSAIQITNFSTYAQSVYGKNCGASVPVPSQSMLLWVSADVGVTNFAGTSPPANNDKVRVWKDQGPLSTPLTNSGNNATLMPFYIASGGPTNKPYLHWADGATSGVLSNYFGGSIGTNFTYYFVVRDLAYAGDYTMNMGFNALGDSYNHRSGAGFWSISSSASGNINLPGAFANNTWAVITIENGMAAVNTGQVRQNGVLFGNLNGGGDSIAGFMLGGASGGNIFHGDIAECLVYGATHSTCVMGQIENYLGSKYGIAVQPPCGLPYQLGATYWWLYSDLPFAHVTNWVDRIGGATFTSTGSGYPSNMTDGVHFTGSALQVVTNLGPNWGTFGLNSSHFVILEATNPATFNCYLSAGITGAGTLDLDLDNGMKPNFVANALSHLNSQPVSQNVFIDLCYVCSNTSPFVVYSYTNGQLANSFNGTGVGTATNWGIAGWAVGEPFSGVIKEIVVYSNKLLSASEVLSLHNYATNTYGYSP
jgi:hypothetical protein